MLVIVNELLGKFLVSVGVAEEQKQAEPTPPAPAKPKNKKTIGFNSGHAGTKGAAGKNPLIQEHIEVMVMCDRISMALKAAGHDVVHIDQTQFNGDLYATGKAFGKVDIGVSVHLNAYNNQEHGAEVLVGDPATLASRTLAEKLSYACATALGIKNRGVKSQSVSIIKGARDAGCPCFVLVESSFIDDETDPAECRRKNLLSADAIAKTLVDWANA